MSKLWAGVTSGETDALADDFNSSIRFDCRMYRQDIEGSPHPNHKHIQHGIHGAGKDGHKKVEF